VKRIFTEQGHISPIVLKTEKETVDNLAGITDPEAKRKWIGSNYIKLFEDVMSAQVAAGKNVQFLLQGTIYSDVIESQGSKHASKIKSHHNVGGLPEQMKLKLLEPLRELYKDEVRVIGEALRLPKEFVWKQPFPGPGYAVRIRGEVTLERLKKIRMADSIVMEELEKEGLLESVFQSFAIMTGAYSTAVKGDEKFFWRSYLYSCCKF
jgi:GMP synthase (glutamine-hydrolysing)